MTSEWQGAELPEAAKRVGSVEKPTRKKSKVDAPRAVRSRRLEMQPKAKSAVEGPPVANQQWQNAADMRDNPVSANHTPKNQAYLSTDALRPDGGKRPPTGPGALDRKGERWIRDDTIWGEEEEKGRGNAVDVREKENSELAALSLPRTLLQ